MRTDTLSFRLFLFTSLWVLTCLVTVAFLASRDYRQAVEKQFTDLVTANLYNLMGSIKPDSGGKPFDAPQPGDSRYRQYHSGWYWTIYSLSDKKTVFSSPSLAGLNLPSPSLPLFDANFQREYPMEDEVGNALMVVEAKAFPGEGSNLHVFRATGNLAALNAEVSRFRHRLIILLGIFGIGLIATSFVIVQFDLKPIQLATSQLTTIRKGKTDSIKGKFPREITPLIEETNTLIKSNRFIIERALIQVENLAHSLKTPLSILSMETKNLPKPVTHTVKSQLEKINSQIQFHLNRAMISARHRGAITARADVQAALSTLMNVFNKLFPDIFFEFYTDPSDHSFIFAGEQRDFEETIGNILENSGNSARERVEINLRQITGYSGPMLEIEIFDDGPGLSDGKIKYVLKRGARLDEDRAGTGLGLSIVMDITHEYGGSVQLVTARTGGLNVLTRLPAI